MDKKQSGAPPKNRPAVVPQEARPAARRRVRSWTGFAELIIASFVAGAGIGARIASTWRLRRQRSAAAGASAAATRFSPEMNVVTYTPLDEDFPGILAGKVVEYILEWRRDPRLILLGRREMLELRRQSDQRIYVLLVENGPRVYFQTVRVLEVREESFLDVVG
ncbi:hypothetical protein SE17_25160 [Kouleothrix aurantiaca]|uniref:Uncharacterized protein n=1 Tax=Kouleothrix aurantiaca TaxID=186479 RepID=A0A0P9H9C9_9CHLR|nr:hypothetical protein SE17_25160 [Kouleothrix aurantiaca]